MKTVWIVCGDPGGWTHYHTFIAAFTTRAKAEAYVEKDRAQEEAHEDDYSIHEATLDPEVDPPSGRAYTRPYGAK